MLNGEQSGKGEKRKWEAPDRTKLKSIVQRGDGEKMSVCMREKNKAAC